jgi:parallel beta-helix repeat protein
MKKILALITVGILCLSTFTIFAPKVRASSPPVGYWKFDEGSGNVAHDSSGNGNDGTIHTAAWVDGKVGKALHFNGVDSWVQVPSSLTLSGLSQITLEVWIKLDNFAPYNLPKGIISKGDGVAMPSPHTEYELALFNNTPSFGVFNGNEVFRCTANNATPDTDTWYHIVGTWNGTVYYVYVNGVLVKSGTNSPISPYSDPIELQIGRIGTWPWTYFAGTIDEVKIYNYARTPQDILNDYREMPVGYWKFDEGSGNTAVDSSGNGNTGTLHGPQWLDGIIGKSLMFDGVNDYVSVPHSSSLDISGNEISVEFWMKLTNGWHPDPGASYIYDQILYDKGDAYTSAMIKSTGALSFNIPYVPPYPQTNKNSWDADTWYHIGEVFDGTQIRIYVNGVLDKAETVIGSVSRSSIQLAIGSHCYGDSNFFNGAIDEFKIYNYARTAEEIWNDYALYAMGPIYIRADGSVDPPAAPIQRDGDLYTLTANITSESDGIIIERNNMTLDGAGYTVQGTGSGNGLYLSEGSNVTIENMEIKTFQFGIRFDSTSNYNRISGNNITNNWLGIRSFSSSNNSISRNTITANNGDGIWLNSSNNNNIYGNNITATTYNGIWLGFSSNNSISRNSIADNGDGIWLYSSSNNSIYHNNFENNAQQVHFQNSLPNAWDYGYPSGGNYWSDYTGSDLFFGSYQNETGSDGIGDTPYVIDLNNQDNYPLMRPYVPFENQTIYIRADGSIDPSGAPIHRTGDFYTVTENIDITGNFDGIVIQRNNMTLDGAGYILQGTGGRYGIDLFGRSNITIMNLEIKAFWAGIMLYGSSNNRITGNSIRGNTEGIMIVYISNNNTITRNNITDNNDAAVWLVFKEFPPYVNYIYHNNFIRNSIEVYDEFENLPSSIVLDDGYPSGGNYWSDYTGIDLYHGPYQNITGSDGIGDVPHDAGYWERRIDYYPLMKPYPWTSHDIGVTSVASSKAIVPQGFNVSISAMLFNYGNYTETINMTIYANETMIGEINNINLESRNFTLVTYTWNTSGFPLGNYTIRTVANPVLGETDLADNSFVDDWILVTKVGDLGGGVPPQFFLFDDAVDGKDKALFLLCYKGTAPPEAMYLADLGGGLPPQFFKCDGVVDGKDKALFLLCYKGQGPPDP